MDLSIIIVNYNTLEYTEKCLESIYNQTKGIELEVILIDNNSKGDDFSNIKKTFPQVRVYQLDKNIGFAGANNYAADIAIGRYLLLLNPDTEILNSGINAIYSFAEENRGYGIYGGRSFFPDGTLNPTSCWGKPTLWSVFCSATGLSSIFRNSVIFDPESLGGWKRDSIREIDIVTGCFLFLEKIFWDELKGFDTDFFMYAEDADLCLRSIEQKKKNIIYPAATFIHHGGASEPIRAEKMIRLFRAEIQLLQKHWSKRKAIIGKILIMFKPFSRMCILYIFKLLSRKYDAKYKSWQNIWIRRNEWNI